MSSKDPDEFWRKFFDSQHPRWYVLDEDHNPVPCKDIALADEWLCDVSKRQVREHYLQGDKIHVSTVFLVLDHNYTKEGPPTLFETMIFGGALDGYQTRSSTWDEAVEHHTKALDKAWAELTKNNEVN